MLVAKLGVGERVVALLGPTSHLLYRTTPSRLGKVGSALNNIKDKLKESGKIWRLRDIFQTKEQGKNRKKDFNKMEISNLLDKEFKLIITKMLTKLEHSE